MEISNLLTTYTQTLSNIDKAIPNTMSTDAKLKNLVKLESLLPAHTTKAGQVAYDLFTRKIISKATGENMGAINETFIRNVLMEDCPELFEKGKFKDKAQGERLMHNICSELKRYNQIIKPSA